MTHTQQVRHFEDGVRLGCLRLQT